MSGIRILCAGLDVSGKMVSNSLRVSLIWGSQMSRNGSPLSDTYEYFQVLRCIRSSFEIMSLASPAQPTRTFEPVLGISII